MQVRPFVATVYLAIAWLCMSCAAQTEHAQAAVAEVRQKFFERTQDLDRKVKGNSTLRFKTLVDLLDQAGPKVRATELTRLKSTQSLGNEYDELLVEAFAELFLRSNDIKGLKNLLSMHCPDYIGSQPLEYRVARSEGQNAIGTLVMAYSQTKSPNSANTLLRCLGRAFPQLRAQYDSDSEFISACSQWTRSDLGRSRLNENYSYLPGQPLPIPNEEGLEDKTPLFVP
jgi:hypothetical protein